MPEGTLCRRQMGAVKKNSRSIIRLHSFRPAIENMQKHKNALTENVINIFLGTFSQLGLALIPKETFECLMEMMAGVSPARLGAV